MSQRSYADILRTGARSRGNRGYELAGSYEEEFPLPPRPQRFPRTRQPRRSRNVTEPGAHLPRREQTNTNPSRHVFERPQTPSTRVTQAPHSFEHFTYVSPSIVQLSNSRRQHSHAQPASHSYSRRYAQGTSSSTATHTHSKSGATESRSAHASYPEPSRTVHMSTNVATKATKRVSHQVTSTPPQYPKEQGRRVTIPEGTTRKHQLQVTVPKTIHNSTSVSIVKHSDRQASDQSRSARVESNACYVEHRDPVSETKKQKVKSVVVSTSSDMKRSRETRVSPSHTKQGSDSRSARSNEKACEEVVNLLKQLYTLVDRQVISDVVAASAAPLNPFNQGLLLRLAAEGFDECWKKLQVARAVLHLFQSSTISKGPPKSEVKPWETIVKKAESTDSGIRKRISETGVSSGIPIKKRRLRRPKCYMKNCKLTMTHVKRHIAGKHLSRSFASWLPMPEEKRMSSINWSLKHLECLLNLDSHEELLSFVLREKWFPEGTKYQLSEEDIDFIKNFHKWSTGQDLLSQPTIDPPSCEAALAHWRVVLTIINYIGEEKVNIAEHDSNEQPRLPVAEHDSSEQPEEAPVREEEKMNTETIVQDESKVCAGAAPAPLDESLLLASADEVSPGSIESSVLLGSPSIAVSADTVSYIDSHMHLDKLKAYSGCQDLTEMLKKGAQPDIQVGGCCS